MEKSTKKADMIGDAITTKKSQRRRATRLWVCIALREEFNSNRKKQ
jgi:hypothetical protein